MSTIDPARVVEGRRAIRGQGGRFRDRVVLVTGAATGIGAAAAVEFAGEGASVGLVGRDLAALDAVAIRIRESGGAATTIVADVRHGEETESAVETLASSYGRLDVVVSNAGIGRLGLVTEISETDVADLLDTHVLALWHLARACVPAMRRHAGGAIVAITSVHAFATLPLLSAYAASKAAILGLVRGLALDHAAEGIRVNAIAPGSVDTPMLQKSAARRDPDDPGRIIRGWGERHPIGRIIDPVEVARAILFLASDDASAITGACLPVDGGLLARLAL